MPSLTRVPTSASELDRYNKAMTDTHAHIHFQEYRAEIDEVLSRAAAEGVRRIITVGVDELDSAEAVAMARAYDHVYASVGLHPHDADRGYEALEEVARVAALPDNKVVAIGECGLDYFRSETSREDQERALRFQIELGLERDLAMIFHVRDAFDDFWRIVDDYRGEPLRGLVHCFSAGPRELEGSLERGFFIALNGIMTFSKDEGQLAAAKLVPGDRLLLETDCPFLTPVPYRGKRNEPGYLKLTAEFLAAHRGTNVASLTRQTDENASRLFRI